MEDRERGKGICSVTWERDVNCCKGGVEKSQKLVQCGESGKKGMAVSLCCMKRVCKMKEEIECMNWRMCVECCMHELENVW